MKHMYFSSSAGNNLRSHFSDHHFSSFLCLQVEQIDNKVLLAAFQEKKRMMEERSPSGSGSQRLFQQVPHQFCNVVCRAGFHRLYSTSYGRCLACPQGASSGLLSTWAQASRRQWMAVEKGSFTPGLQGWSLLEMVTLLSFLSFVCGQYFDVSMDSRMYGSGFNLFPVCVLAILSEESTLMCLFLTFLISTKLSISTSHSIVRS